jgi:hypothetical protein
LFIPAGHSEMEYVRQLLREEEAGYGRY